MRQLAVLPVLLFLACLAFTPAILAQDDLGKDLSYRWLVRRAPISVPSGSVTPPGQYDVWIGGLFELDFTCVYPCNTYSYTIADAKIVKEAIFSPLLIRNGDPQDINHAIVFKALNMGVTTITFKYGGNDYTYEIHVMVGSEGP